MRIVVSITPDDRRRLMWWARKKGKTLPWAIQEAIYCYLVPIKATADAETLKKPRKARVIVMKKWKAGHRR